MTEYRYVACEACAQPLPRPVPAPCPTPVTTTCACGHDRMAHLPTGQCMTCTVAVP